MESVMKYLYLLITVAFLSSCASEPKKVSLWDDSPKPTKWFIYSMKSATEMNSGIKHPSAIINQKEAAITACQTTYNDLKLENALDLMEWGVKVADAQTNESKIYECKPLIKTTN